ncbi:MAG: polysaccharide biosynthesis protein, partial [Elusimicrobiales bacterium]|nr:polysaccharide biosynthesis protein [Elusimicrobiales bacterium]
HITFYIGGMLFQAAFLLSSRFVFRFMTFVRHSFYHENDKVSRVMIIGAGEAGHTIIKEMSLSVKMEDKVCCIVDDDPVKQNCFINNIPIVGGRDTIAENVKKYKIDKIYFAIPTASPKDRSEILNICKETGCQLKQLPGIYQLINGQVSVSSMKDVSVVDLLGRSPIKADLKEVFEFIHEKTVLVTGGGGSIGSELCRQIAVHRPKKLIILEIYENNAYDIQLELREKYPWLDLQVLIGSVRDSRRMFQIFSEYRPEIVYHAAAHKHVPLMEDSPNEAIKNNAIGTYKTAFAAMTHGCKRFVLISTDKAVNPTNIMGASKRLCEQIIQSFDAKIKQGKADEIPQLFTHEISLAKKEKQEKRIDFADIKTEFVAVRFGNVLGSNGSVIPVFKKQIANGGPVTVTHPDIVRYFMTIPEAVSLVMLAGTYAKGGEIFVLDMGSPVKIVDLATNLIKLSGYKPGVDIKIEFTGLRPGEKIYEEKLMAEEGLKKTQNNLIHIGCPIPFDTDEFLKKLEKLMYTAYTNEDDICDIVADMVSTYKPAKNETYARIAAKAAEK